MNYMELYSGLSDRKHNQTPRTVQTFFAPIPPLKPPPKPPYIYCIVIVAAYSTDETNILFILLIRLIFFLRKIAHFPTLKIFPFL